jgi:hypothetical protein
MVRDLAQNPGREEHRNVAEVGKVNLLLVTREDAGNDQVVGAGDQREEAHPCSPLSRAAEASQERRIRPELAPDARMEPIGVVGAAMRRTERDTPIDAPRAPELLEVDPSDESPKAVANEIDAATADVLPEVLTQRERGLLDPGVGTVVERKDLLEAAKTKVRSYREQGRSIREVAVDENDGPLIRLARRALIRPFDPERKERSGRAKAESFLRDGAPCRSFGHPIVLDHGVPPTR